jgi:AcrR family transcriptional regulator
VAVDLVTRQREERKERILDAARLLIADRGYDAVTMRDLAEKSLVSVPTLYNLFGSKNELLFAAVEYYFADLVENAGVVEPEDGLAKIISLTRTLGRETPRHAAYVRSMMGFIGSASDTGGINDLVAGQLSNEMIGALEQMQSKRQLATWADPRPLAACLANQISITTFEWARQQLSDEALEGAMLYAAAVTLLGAARGKAAGELEDLVRRYQSAASETMANSREREEASEEA